MRRGLAMSGAAAVVASLLATAVLMSAPAAAQEGTAETDLGTVALRPEDLPEAFVETADLFTIGGLVAELLDRAEGAPIHQHRAFAHDTGTEVVESLLIGPLSQTAQEEFDAWLTDPVAVVGAVAATVPPFGTSGTWAVRDTAIGDSSFACWITATEALEDRAPEADTRLELALARRDAYLVVVAVTHDGEGEPLADAVGLAGVLDRRLAEALGLSTGGFRPPGLLVPDLTTHIPTAADVSTDPAVIGANLLLAGLAMLAFVVASEVLDNTLSEHEALLQRVVAPARWLGRAQRRLDGALASRMHTGRALDRLRLLGIVAIYGLVFSFLEPGWHPFSLTGFWLFLTLALACGLVGISGDIAQRAVARRRGIPTTLELRPANLITAMASTGLSRAFALVPGLLFGRPEALEIDERSLEPPAGARVLGAGALTLAAVAGVAWLLTLPTSLLQGTGLPGWLAGGIGGIEALLLLVFAVAVQNLFLEMLTLPGTAGRYLSRRHPFLWFIALVGAGFAFWHTLINPRGDLAAAVQTANVRFFLAVVGLFVLFAIGVRGYARRMARPAPTPGPPAHASPDDPTPEATGGPEAPAPAAAWHPDPTGRHQYRYWEGSRWTDWVADNGVTGRDPVNPG